MNDEAWAAYLRDLAPALVLRDGSSQYLAIPAALDALDWLLANGIAVLGAGESLTIDLGEIGSLRERCPEQLAALVDWTAWANSEQIDSGNEIRVSLAFRE